MGDLNEDRRLHSRTQVRLEASHRPRTVEGAISLPSGDNEDACPYQGLAPFEAASTELFFGRARATDDLLERLGARLEEHGSVLLVSGASGVGKSSLLRAGLMPALAEGMLPVAGSQHWPRLLITPTARPLQALAEAWAKAHGGHVEGVREQLRDDPQHALPDSLSPADRLVLVVDQFEELFTLVTDERERQAFVRALHALADGPSGAGVIVGLRADYWDRCAAYPQFAEAIQDGQVIVEPMTESDLRLAITGPAAAVGLEIEPGLVETVLGELRADWATGDRYEAGALPLLSQALRNTWERRENGRLTIRGYEESGRVRDSVRRTADEVLGRLSTEDRKTALKLFRRMTVITAGGRVARRTVTLPEIHAAVSAQSEERRREVDALLSAFAGQRLLTLHEGTVEIVHDALLTAWPTLRQWLQPDLAAQVVYDGLIGDAEEWDDNHRDPAFLHRGARLLTVQNTRPRWDRDPDSFPPFGPTVEAFIAASTAAARRTARRRGLVTAGLVVLSVLAFLAAGTAINAANNADQQRRLAVSRQLTTQSEVTGDATTSALLAVAAWRIAPTPEARYRMLVAAASSGRGTLTGHRSPITALAFSPDGTTIATGSKDKTVRLWDTASRRQLGAPIVFPERCILDIQVAFSPDGRLLAGTCLETVRFWDVSTHRPVGSPLDIGAGDNVSAIAFGPDGTLATGSLRNTVRLWDVATRRQRGDTMGRATEIADFSGINAVAFSPDGKLLATAGDDRTVRLWDTATHNRIGAPLTGHTGKVLDVSFRPDGKFLATTSLDRTTRLWNLTTHRQIGPALTSEDKSFANGLAFSPNGKRLATAGNDGTRLWDAIGLQEVATFTGNGSSTQRVAFSPDGRLLAAADGDVVRLEDPATHQQIGSTMPGLSAVALSPDGRTLATGSSPEPDPAIRLWDVATQRPVGRQMEFTDPSLADHAVVDDITFGPNGRILVTKSADGVRIWDVAGRRQIGPVVPMRPGDVAEPSPDGRFLAIEHGDSVLFWDVAGHREIMPRLQVPGPARVSEMAISPDGATLATTGFDRRVRVYDVVTRHQIGDLLPFATDGLDLAFSPDGRTLAVTADDNTVRLWDLAGRRPVRAALTGHAGPVKALAFSPDGKALVTVSVDGTVRLWDLLTHRQIGAPMAGHVSNVIGIAYSSDGTTVATVGAGTVRLWNVALPADPAATVCANVGRSLTRAEWERFVPGEEFQQICR